MENELEELAPSKRSAAKTMFATFKILKDAGGQLPGRQVIDKIRETVELTDWEKQVYEKTGYVRWESILHFYTIDGIKAGFLRKNKGVWYLTEEGEKAISLGPAKLLKTASQLYRTWAADNKDTKPKKGKGEPESKTGKKGYMIPKLNADLAFIKRKPVTPNK